MVHSAVSAPRSADINSMPPARNTLFPCTPPPYAPSTGRIEKGDRTSRLPGPGWAQLESASDGFQDRRGEITVQLLCGFKNLKQRVARVVVARHGSFELLGAVI